MVDCPDNGPYPWEQTEPEPDWLRAAPEDFKPLLEIGYEIYGDDREAVVSWLRRVYVYATNERRVF